MAELQTTTGGGVLEDAEVARRLLRRMLLIRRFEERTEAQYTRARIGGYCHLAAVWHLPIVFQIINNLYGMGTSVEQASGEPELWRRGCAYRMHGERVDGNDVLAVREAAGRLLDEARRDRRPSLLETVTYRW